MMDMAPNIKVARSFMTPLNSLTIQLDMMIGKLKIENVNGHK